jgi:hypothetical protein
MTDCRFQSAGLLTRNAEKYPLRLKAFCDWMRQFLLAFAGPLVGVWGRERKGHVRK